MSASSSTTSSTCFPPPDHHHLSPSDQLCYVHCNFCDTVLAVSVPCSSLVFKSVTVRCGHCSNLLSVPLNIQMRGLLLPAANYNFNHQLHLSTHSFFTPQNHLEQIQNTSSSSSSSSPSSNLFMNQQLLVQNDPLLHVRAGLAGPDHHEIPKSSVANKPPEKRQRVPSAYNRFIKDEIQRIKAGNPDISHREAFSAAAKNWAHFPHIHFGLMPDHQPVKKPNLRQEGEDVLIMKENGFFSTTAANVGVSPY